VTEAAAGYAFFAGDHVRSGFRLGASADHGVTNSATAGAAINEVASAGATVALLTV
jgi:hypothetical protein